MAQRYQIIRKFYRNTKAIEDGVPYRVYNHGFDPLTLEDAKTIRTKLATPALAIDSIVPYIQGE